MKVCDACGDSYRDHVDFCFNDGEVLVAADAANFAGAAEGELDAPPAPRRDAMNGSPDPAPTAAAPSAQRGSQAGWAMSATPVPRPNRRSLLGKTSTGGDGSPGPGIRDDEAAHAAPSTSAPTGNAPDEAPAEPSEPMPVAPVPAENVEPGHIAQADRILPSRPPASEVDTAPMPRPVRAGSEGREHASPVPASAAVTPVRAPEASAPTAAKAASAAKSPSGVVSAAAVPTVPPGAQGARSPTRAPRSTPPGRVATLEPEPTDDREGSGMLMVGIAAAVLGMFFVIGSGVVLLAMGSGLIGDGTPFTDAVAVQEPAPPTPAPAPPIPPPLPQPIVQVDPPTDAAAPQPIEVAPVPAPLPAPVAPVPQAVAAPQPAPTPIPRPVAPAPVPPKPPTPAPAPTGAVPKPSPAPAPAPVPALVTPVQVSFSSDPPGAEVWVDGVRVLDKTPGTAELAPGDHRWEMRLPDHVSSTGKVNAAGASAQVAGTLAAEQAAKVGKVMFFHAGFTGAMLIVDGENRGSLPATIEQLPEGRHSFKIVNPMTGEEFLLSREITLKEGGAGPTIVHLDQQ